MKTSTLKILIKEVMKELLNKKTGSRASIYENYPIELESLVLPNISTEKDVVEVTISIEYEYEPGESASGMYGPPENSSPGSSSTFNIIDYYPTNLAVFSEDGNHNEVNIETLTPEQKEILNSALISYVENHEDKIEQDIKDNLESNDVNNEDDYEK